MKFRLLPVVAAAALLAACSTASEDAGSKTATGNTAPTTAGKAGPVAGSVEEFKVVVGDRVLFGFDQYNLSAEGQAVLKNQAAWLNKYTKYSVVVEGHADERGTREYNLALGERRANSVKAFLAAQGVKADRLKVVSYGKERPECGDSTEACWAKNRRGVSVLQ
ncbi:peptidoglycan-associated lipoprotein Pal [Novispirillum itersonii]|uniref:peptidoglycan-associated lipoprotein Pal n=1 Tax=Novispirillum itersonii TaxID=189 RepID=UPI00035D2FE4|nr:peptidoglycan-associated lipoprotein Pal [Novispirillum itersonii]